MFRVAALLTFEPSGPKECSSSAAAECVCMRVCVVVVVESVGRRVVRARSLQSCPTLCNPVDCSSPVSSVHGILRQEYWCGLPCPGEG